MNVKERSRVGTNRNMFRIFILLECVTSIVLGNYQLIFDSIYSPPRNISKEESMYYSVPLNEEISKPIIAYFIYSNGTRITDGPLSNSIVRVLSIDVNHAQDKKILDDWKYSGGALCQHAVWDKDYPWKADRSQAKIRCGTAIEKTVLTVRAFNGRIIVDGIFHQHTVVPVNARILRIISISEKIWIDSYPFLITIPAAYIEISKAPPATILANHPFQMTATIRDKNGNIVTTGLDSIAYVDLTVPYYNKTFYYTEGRKMLLKHTSVRLGGEIIYHQSTQDLVIRKRASKGVVTFNEIRILNIVNNLQLNLTMTMARFPWTRIPNCVSCYDDVKSQILQANGTEVTFPYLGSKFYTKIKSLVLTQPFQILPQTVSHLKVSNETLEFWNEWTDPNQNAIYITRNIPLPGGFTVFALDNSLQRIYSGSDAYLKLKYTTEPPGVCISNDATTEVVGGSAHLFVSICQVITKVRILVTVENKTGISVTTPYFHVGGNLHIAYFGDFSFNGDGVYIDPHVDSFVNLAVYDINNGVVLKDFAKAGFKLELLSYDTKSNIENTLDNFYSLHKFASNPKNPLLGLISSATDDITKALSPQLSALEMSYISTSNSDVEFSDKFQHPYFNRVCWSYSFLTTSVVKMVKERKWFMLIILRESSVTLSYEFRKAMKVENIDIRREIAFPHIKSSKDDVFFKNEMALIKQWRCQIIFLFAHAKMQSYILRAAYINGLDSENGYQWVIVGQYAWEFPFYDLGVCSQGIKACTQAFKNTILLGETYNVTTSGDNWIRVLQNYFASDRFHHKNGVIKYRSLAVTAKMALGYDATLLLVNALVKLVTGRESFTGPKVNSNMRNIYIDGLTGQLYLNSYGDRVGFMGFLAQVNTVTREFNFIRLLLLDSLKKQFEIPYETYLKTVNRTAILFIPKSMKYNVRNYLSLTGKVSLKTQRLIPHGDERWPPEGIIRRELIISVFYCEQNCGFNTIDETDINRYDSGKCTSTGVCQCQYGYGGRHCMTILCDQCRHGLCISPYVCQCHAGWYGDSCSKPYCYDCQYGKCHSPYKCTCFPRMIGRDCSIHVAALVIPLILGLILLSVIMYFGIKKFLDHSRQKSALSNLSWVIYWSAVECCQPELSFISRTSVTKRSLTFLTAQTLETYIWQNEKWYVKKIPSSTISLDDVNVRLEMVELTQVKHVNLIRFGGACLTAPHVSFFLEIAHKGSLNDVLHLASFDLGWEFRYSFMKDICSGMRYLHEETRIGSHGRLKSLNCLIDSHWTVKISGFGAPSIRYGKYRLPREENTEDAKSLLWTAPELLENANCLDDIKNGTKDGDVYSFAIIISEILTWADPYEYELEYISERALIDLIKDPFNQENQSTRLKWKEIGGTNMLAVRPILREEHLAQTVLRRKMIRHILAEAWDQVPSSRPSFKKLLLMLEECYPASGGLIDNLITLLSSYSNNLEIIVLERTKEIEESKEKSEHLLSQLLPRNIAEDLKQGRKIIPELFECVTVFFSDIVDFAEILLESTPFEIVDFLNEMYNAFDNTVNKHNVYKVETICDTYIVVSGLPERIGPQHAGEIATMSLDLMSLVTTFKIPHKPDATLQLRIGIHSGPVVSGIVGTLMPRYCLFGDSVNTASRMESSSIALQIQLSDSTAKILQDLGGYNLECRGMREVKGRGLMCTWWLIGKDGFDQPLPDKSRAISLSRHRFK